MAKMKIEVNALPPRPQLEDIAVENDLTVIATESDESEYCFDRWRVHFKGNDKIAGMGESVDNALRNFAQNLQGRHLTFGERTVVFPDNLVHGE